MTVGVLALQGGVREHARALRQCGAEVVAVRNVAQLQTIDSLVVPGGESTTIGKLLQSSGLLEAIKHRVADDLPVFGTCAGMILSARRLVDGTGDQPTLGIFDAVVRRNGVGPQRYSSEEDLAVAGLGSVPAVFIRPPVVESVGDGVEVLASNENGPVLCREGRNLFASFHPELTDSVALHEFFLSRT